MSRLTTSNFIVIKDTDLNQTMPSAFARDGGYYKLDQDEVTKLPITWQELMDNYEQFHGGEQSYVVDSTPVHLIKMELSPICGDFSESAAFAYGVGKTAPIGQVMNWKEAKEFINQYTTPDELG